MKTNKEKNTEHDQKRVRPKQPAYDFAPLEAVIRQWVLGTK
jgi:hypothetical protein